MSAILEDVEKKLSSMEPTNLLDIVILLQAIGGLLFLLISFSVAYTPNVGFITLLSALIFLFYPAYSYLTIHIWKSALTYGISLGAGIIVCFLGLMTAIFWGQLSFCEEIDDYIYQYECSNTITYRIICLLSVTLFIFQLGLTVLLAHYQLVILKDLTEYNVIREESDDDLTPYSLKSNNPASRQQSAEL